MADTLDIRYRKAVASARHFRRAGADWQAKSNPEAVAAELDRDAPEVLDHNLRVLIEEPERPKEATLILEALAIQRLQSGRPMPARLSAWTAERLAGRIPTPRKGGDPHAIRDLLIQHCILALARAHRLRPTRAESEGPKAGAGQSACDAAGEAWGLNYKAVERIWGERRGDIREASDCLL